MSFHLQYLTHSSIFPFSVYNFILVGSIQPLSQSICIDPLGLPTHLKFTQPVLIQSFQDKFKLPTENYKTPAEPGEVLGPVLEGQELDQGGQSKYRSIVGKMLHLMRWSRPDIWNSTREASIRMQKANNAHEMMYCTDTRDQGWKLKLTRKWNGKDKNFEFILIAKSDSNYAT
jgi:hypothetical protein